MGFARLYRRSDAVQGLTLLSPLLLIMLAALAAPLALLALYSFWSQNGYALDTHFTLAQYATAIGRPSYRILFYRSLGISSLVTVITVLLAYPMAYFVAFHAGKSKFIWLILLTIPFWTSYLLRVFAWKLILGYNGVINSSLISLGLIHQPLEFLLYNPTAVVVTLAHAWAPFAILPIYVSLEKIDRSLLEAASDLGDGPVRRFFRVTLPLSLPGVIGAAVLIFVPTTGDYVTPALVGGSQGVMIANVIEEQFDKVANWPLGAALALSSMAAVGILTYLFVKAVNIAAARIR
ncbi:MAG TPA: ABC transporter permease [Rhizomicrobium sp.]|nr:ABC transporter permease [Rhizomicrobium sp.]